MKSNIFGSLVAFPTIVLFTLAVRAQAQCEQKVTDTSNAGEQFGAACSLSSNLFAVGGPFDDPVANAGSVLVYERSGANSWSLQKKITNTLASGDEMGAAVSISLDHVIAGAKRNLSNRGAAYIFRQGMGGTNSWGLVKKLQQAGGVASDLFGVSVGISGDTAIVGSLEDPGTGFNAGSASIFDRNLGGTNNWGERIKIIASDSTGPDWFGNSVAISGDTVIVGAPLDDNAGGADAGSAYIFMRNQGGTDNWGQVKKILGGSSAANDHFGWSVAIYGDSVLVGAPRHSTDDGAMYVFERNQGGANNWGQTALLSAGCNNAQLGTSVALSSIYAAGGGTSGCGAGGISTGATQVFGRNQGGIGAWGFVTELLASDGAAGDSFGASSAATDGDWVGCGAPLDDSATHTDSGSAYVYRMQGCAFAIDYCYCNVGPCGNPDPNGGCANSTGSGARLVASGSGSVSADDLVLSCSGMPASVSGLFFKGSSAISTPFEDGYQCAGGTVNRYAVQAANGSGVMTLGTGIVALSSGFSPGAIVSGSSWNYQVWYRNTFGPCGSGANLSNAVTILFSP